MHVLPFRNLKVTQQQIVFWESYIVLCGLDWICCTCVFIQCTLQGIRSWVNFINGVELWIKVTWSLVEAVQVRVSPNNCKSPLWFPIKSNVNTVRVNCYWKFRLLTAVAGRGASNSAEKFQLGPVEFGWTGPVELDCSRYWAFSVEKSDSTGPTQSSSTEPNQSKSTSLVQLDFSHDRACPVEISTGQLQ